MPKRTYVDSCVLIAAYRGTDDLAADAIAVLDDPERQFVISHYLKLEVLPKPRFHKKEAEVAFMEEFISSAHEDIGSSDQITNTAIGLASEHDLGPVDALHVSVAKTAKVDEFITLEAKTKPLFRVRDVNIVGLRD